MPAIYNQGDYGSQSQNHYELHGAGPIELNADAEIKAVYDDINNTVSPGSTYTNDTTGDMQILALDPAGNKVWVNETDEIGHYGVDVANAATTIIGAQMNIKDEITSKMVITIAELDDNTGFELGSVTFEAIVTTNWNKDAAFDPTESRFSEYGHVATGTFKEYNNRPVVTSAIAGTSIAIGDLVVNLSAVSGNANTLVATASKMPVNRIV